MNQQQTCTWLLCQAVKKSCRIACHGYRTARGRLAMQSDAVSPGQAFRSDLKAPDEGPDVFVHIAIIVGGSGNVTACFWASATR